MSPGVRLAERAKPIDKKIAMDKAYRQVHRRGLPRGAANRKITLTLFHCLWGGASHGSHSTLRADKTTKCNSLVTGNNHEARI